MQDGKQGGITPFQAKGGNHTNLLHVAAINEEQKNWPTVCASEVRQGFQDRSRGMKGSQESLTTVVVKDAANWLTPQSGDVTGSTQEAVVMWANGKRPKTSDQRLRTQVAAEQLKYGQAAPASSSSLGSRQGLWPTASVPNGGQTTSGRADKDTKKQVRLEHAVRQELWLTPRANEPTGDSTFVTRNGDRGQHCSPSLTIQVEKAAQWGTPAANDANKQNVMCEVNSKQAGLPKSVGLELQRQWATPRNCGEPDYAKTTRPSSQSNSLSLPTQVAGKLNPRWVEALMGLPIGWVMPSCTSPQTIALMSCDSSAMELCLPPQSELSEFSLAS
jgi:hypothetical protein